jgi:hypothetical protein
MNCSGEWGPIAKMSTGIYLMCFFVVILSSKWCNKLQSRADSRHPKHLFAEIH